VSKIVIQNRTWLNCTGFGWLLWGISVIALAQGTPPLDPDLQPLDLKGVNIAERLSQLSAPNSFHDLERKYQDCKQQVRDSAQKRGEVNIDVSTACKKEKDAFKKLLGPKLQARGDVIEQDNKKRRSLQRKVLADADAYDRKYGKSEEDYPPGNKVQRSQIVLLANCQAEAVATKQFELSDCPERLELDDKDLQAINSYTAKRLADRGKP
jgi:hypothetical protein